MFVLSITTFTFYIYIYAAVDMLYWWQTFHICDLLTSDILACLILLMALCKHPISQVVILNFCLLVIANV